MTRSCSFSARDRPLLLLLTVYAGFSPVLVLRFGEDASAGLPDLLLPVACLTLIGLWGRIRVTAPIVIYLAYIALTVVSSVASLLAGTPVVNLILTERLLAVFMPFLLVFQIDEFGEAAFGRLLAAFLIGGAVALTAAAGLHLAGIEVREQQQRLWLDEGSVSRAAGLTGNTGEFGHLVSLWMLAAVVLTPLAGWRYRAIIQFAGLAGGGYLLLISASHSGFLHLVAGLAIVALFWHARIIARLRFPQVAAIVTGLIVALGCAGLLADEIQTALFDPAVASSIERLDILNLSGRSNFVDETRLSNWPSIIDSIGNHPILGVGFKNYTWSTDIFVDNAFISSLLEGGILAGLTYLTFWIVMVLTCLRLALLDGRYGGAAVAFLVSDLSHALTLDIQTLWYSAPSALMLVAMLMRCADTVSQERMRPATPISVVV